MGAPLSPRFTPPALREGDRVRVIAPASPVQPHLLDGGLELLTSWQLSVDDARGAYAKAQWPLEHCAGSDRHRATELLDALTAPDVSAVFCARGGTALGRVLEQLTNDQWDRIAHSAPRWVVGSSDVTALHCALGERAGWATLFAPMVATDVLAGEQPDVESREALYRALFEGSVTVSAESVSASSGEQLVQAPVVGGTITVIETMLGTPEAGTAEGCIAFLEEIGEAPRRLDRALTHLRRAGWFAGVRAVIVGTLIDCGNSARDVVLERVSDLGVPIVIDAQVGHGPRQLSIPLGVPVSMNTQTATITWSSASPVPRDDESPRVAPR